MRPARTTGAHRSGNLAELVCSNSLKSDEPNTAPRLLKDELRAGGSLLARLAKEVSVPAGGALAVDREKFSALVTETLSNHPNVELRREEVATIGPDEITVIAAGPLASPALVGAIGQLTGERDLYFFDAISPIVDGETIDYNVAFKAARYGKGGDDYVNCPMSKDEYDRFYDALVAAEKVTPHEGMQAEDEAKFFEGCLPIEEIARRGRDTLRFGPMKPVGLTDPRTGREPYACVQLRLENLLADAYNLVGFQCHIKYGEQKRVLRLIPGLENAEFIRFGQMHRNTYICSPKLLRETLQMRAHPRVLFAGQISGIEGYTEAMATGMIAGMNASRLARGLEPAAPPRESATGSLTFYLANASEKNFQPANTTFALLPEIEPDLRRRLKRKADRHRFQVERGLSAFNDWLARIGEREQSGQAQTV
jgi:methylenetetrahydrofolate--tRNA-(uracil-5-)-methyltransferase